MRARIVIASLLALPLAGCLSVGGKNRTPPELLALSADQAPAAGAATRGKAADALLVLEPETDRRLAVLRVPVQVDAARVAYLKDVQWIDRPARQFAHLLAETLRAQRGGALVVEAGDGVVAPGARLGGRLAEMGYDAQARAVVVRFDALRTDLSGEVRTRRFEATIPGVAPRADQVGPALNRAANRVAGEVAEWLAGE